MFSSLRKVYQFRIMRIRSELLNKVYQLRTMKMYGLGTIRILAELLKKTMTPIIWELIDFSWNDISFDFIFVRRRFTILLGYC